MSREEILDTARYWARHRLAKGELTLAVAEFLGQCRVQGLDPPLHHADVTKAMLDAEGGDKEAVVKWIDQPR